MTSNRSGHAVPSVGVSLPPAYLNGNAQGGEHRWNLLFGLADAALEQMKEAGAESIELRTIRAGADPCQIVKAIQKVIQHDLKVTLHGLLPPPGSSSTTPGAFPLWEVQEELRAPTIVVLHARTLPEGTVEEAASETLFALEELLAENDRRGRPFTFALEINRSKAKVDPSYTWHGVSKIVDRINALELGICWDFGHAWYNARRAGLTPFPPEAFLKKVVHTHIHDLGPEDVTHWPLDQGNVPVQRICGLLVNEGYHGVFNLEVEPQRYPDKRDSAVQILESIRALVRARGS